MANEFKVLFGVEFNTSSIEKQVKKVQDIASSTDIKITPKIDESNLNAGLRTSLNKLTQLNNATIKLNRLDTSQLDSSLNNKINEIKNRIKTITDDVKLQIHFDGKLDGDTVSVIDKTIAEYKVLYSSVNKVKTETVDLVNKSKSLNKIESYMRENSKATQQYGDRLNNLKNSMNNATSDVELKNLNKQFATLRKEIDAAGLSGKTLGDIIKNDVSKFGEWIVAGTLFMQVTNAIKTMITNVRELDSSMIELKKVTDETNDSYQEFYDYSSEVAKNLGTATKEVISSAAAWAQMGYNLKQATEAAKTTSIFKTISPEMSLEQSQESLISTTKAYKIEIEDMLDGVASKVNIVGNNLASTNSDIAEILKRSASAMSAANNSLEQNIALGVAANEIVQNPEKVGNGLKSVAFNIRALDEETQTYNKSLESIKENIQSVTGVSAFTDETKQTYKSTYQYLSDISDVFDDLTDKEQAFVASELFGKYQSNTGLAILSNFESARKAMDLMVDSTGNALSEFEKASDSIDFKINALNQTFVSISQNVINSDFFKFTIDSLTTILGLIDDITSYSGGIGIILGGLGAYAGANGLNISNMFNFKNGIGSSLIPKELKEEIPTLVNQIKDATLNVEELKNKFGSSSDTIIKYANNLNGTTATTEGLSSALGKAAIKQKLLQVQTVATNIALNMFVGLAIGAAVNLAIKAFDELIVTQQELEDKIKDSKNAYDETTSSLDSVNKELEENYKRIRDIQSQDKLSYIEQSELDKLKQTTKELENQKKLLENKQSKDAMELALNTAIASKKYGKSDLSIGDMYNRGKNTDFTENGLINTSDVVIPNILRYEQLVEQLNKINIGTEQWSDKQSEVNDQQTKLNDLMMSLSSDINNYEVVIDKITEKDKSRWSSTEKSIFDAYNKAKDYYDLILKTTDPNTYYQNEFDNIFNREDIELTRDELLELAKEGSLNELDISNFKNLNKAIEESGLKADENGSKINEFKNQIESLLTVSKSSIDVMGLANDLESSKDIFDDRKDIMTELADLVDALGKSFTLSAEEARKFVDVFPDLLAQGQVTSDGLIKFNKSVVDSYIESKKLSTKADIEARISELENAKIALTGLKQNAEAKLTIAQSCANGEISLDKAKEEILSLSAKGLTQYLIDLGLDEQEAQAAVLSAQAGNMEEYSRIVGNIGGDIAYNMASAMASAANSTSKNVGIMARAWDKVGTIVSQVANQVKNSSNGKVTYNNGTGNSIGSVVSGATGVFLNSYQSKNSSNDFKAAEKHDITAQKKEINRIIENVKLDISTYTDAIAGIDTQINLLKANLNTSLDKYSSGKYKDKNKKESDFSKTFDWISVAIQRLESEISKLDTTANSVYKTWGDRNNALSSQIGKITDEIALQTASYNVYMAQANSVGLSSYYKNLVQKGALDIDVITDKDLAEKIESYQDFYESANEISKKIQDLTEDLSSLYVQRFNNSVSYWESRIEFLETQINDIQTMVDINEAKGLFSSKSYYDGLIKIEKENISMLEQERKELINALNEGVNTGSIAKYSETWYDLQNQINNVNSSILDANKSLIEFNNDIRDLDWEIFDYMQDSISSITDEVDFLNKLISKNKMFDENGKNTEYSNAIFALMGINYNTYMSQANEYAKAIKELDDMYKNDSLNKDYLARRKELVELQQESILNAEEEKQSIIDLIEDGYNAQLDALEKLIDKRKDELNITKDIYDYQKQISDKTKNIAQLEKQLSAYMTDNSTENQKTIQDLKNEIQNAKDDLQETEYEKYLSDQEALLDNLYSSFEEWISIRLDNVDGLITETINSINGNSENISETIKSSTSEVGYTISDTMKEIMNSDTTKITDMLSNYNGNFDNKMTTLQSAIDNIKLNVADIVNKSNNQSQQLQDVQNTQQIQAPVNNTPTITVTPNPINNNTSSSSNSSNTTVENLKNIFVYKKSGYNKSALKRYTSIVDALKYYDFDSSFSIRQKYYSKLGGSGKYTGSSSQNTWMLSKFRQIMGYRDGGIVGSLQKIVDLNGDDGFTINTLKKGEAVLNPQLTQEWIKLQESLPQLNRIISEQSNFGDVQIYMDLSGIQNYEQFRNALMSDRNVDSYIKTVINSSLTNGMNLKKNKFKK